MSYDFSKIKALLGKATKKKWRFEKDFDGGKFSMIQGDSDELNEGIALIPHDDCTTKGWKEMKANAALIVELRNSIEGIMQAYEELERENEKLSA